MKKTLIFLFVFALTAARAQNYIFYLHGMIIENQGPRAVEKINGYGAYLYFDILDSLRNKNNTVISEVRQKNTDVKSYALKVKGQIDSLLTSGVKAQQITVIGASKGSVIAMYVSSFLKNKEVNYVFMAACSDQISDAGNALTVYGNILSIYEKSDVAGSCATLKANSTGINHYKELELNTGLRHGFLYKPLREWVQPTLKWANRDYK